MNASDTKQKLSHLLCGRVISNLDYLYIAFAGFCILYGRWLSIIYPIPLNPDEAQMAANTLRITFHGFNWNALDGTTVGPLSSVILLWPHIIGWDVTFSTTRLTAGVLLFFVCSLLYFAIKILGGRFLALLFLAPLVVFYAFTKRPDFLHYSSELLSLFFLVAANYFAVSISTDRNKNAHRVYSFLCIGILLGAVPFAKLQATPLAFAIGIYALFLATLSSPEFRLGHLIALICGGTAPGVLILFPLVVSGKWHDFWYSYIVWAGLYVGKPISLLAIYGMIAYDVVLKYVVYFILSVGIISLIQSNIMRIHKNVGSEFVNSKIIYAALLALISVWIVSKPGWGFPHYLMFLPPFLIFFFACTAQACAVSRVGRFLFASYYALLAIIFITLFINNERHDLKNFRNKYATVLKQGFSTECSHLLSWLPVPAKHLLVWGWMPQWYVWSGLAPASRESHTNAQIVSSDLSSYFRSRFLFDVEASSPEIILDAVAGNSFKYNDSSKYSPAIFPAFATFITKKYTLLSPLVEKSNCPRIYIKNEYKDLIAKRFITPASIVASSTYGGENSCFSKDNLFDLSVTEDSCIDYWLLPDHELGSLRMTLSKVESISSLMILNTRNGNYIDRSTRGIKVTFMDSDGAVVERFVTMRPYPYWTVINYDGPVNVKRILLDIVSFEGLGGGLNEIKIIRAN